MVPYFGDFDEDATVRFVFNTFDSNDPSASVIITNLADADLKVHKDGSITQIVTDGATVVINFDSITGNHMVTIDTSVHADYTTGADYHVRMEGTTVDGAMINAFIGHFSIENRTVNVGRWAGTDVVAGAIPAFAADAAGGLVVSDAGGLDIDAMNAAAIRLTAARAAILTDWINDGRLDVLLDAVSGGGATNIATETTIIESET
jgi:hypothetical protein